MKTNRFIAAAVALSVAGASAPVMAQSTNQVLKGAGIGAAGGAVAGAIIPGLGVGEGLLIGAGSGAVITALTKGKHRYYRDSAGRKYWVDKRGHRRYK